MIIRDIEKRRDAAAAKLERVLGSRGMSEPLKSHCSLKGGTGFPESFQGKQEGTLAFIKVSDIDVPPV